jgi:hypothetical protein
MFCMYVLSSNLYVFIFVRHFFITLSYSYSYVLCTSYSLVI